MFSTMRKDSPKYVDYCKLTELGFTFIRSQPWLPSQQTAYIQFIYGVNITLYCRLIITIDYNIGMPAKYSAHLQDCTYSPIKITPIAEADTLDQLIEDIIYVASK